MNLYTRNVSKSIFERKKKNIILDNDMKIEQTYHIFKDSRAINRLLYG